MRSMMSSGLGRRWLLVALAVVSISVVALVAAAVQSASGAVRTLATFKTPGYFMWKVPAGVTRVTFDVFGAQGGSVVFSQGGIVTLVANGGAGGEAKGKFAVRAGETFEIVVGGQGGLATEGQATGAGGFNGGGAGDATNIGVFVGGGGGGGSDVRIGVRGNACAASKACGYGDRIIVGGGGGGGGQVNGIDGDAGGGLTGSGRTCADGAGSATQECAGGQASSECAGSTASQSVGGFGFGGTGCEGTGWGGGGGGWYGGGGLSPAGGGSGFVSPLSATGSFPGGTNLGDGIVKITT